MGTQTKARGREIRTVEDLPPTGLILQSDFLSNKGDVRLIPFSSSHWRRMVRTGEAPPAVHYFGRLSNHAEHIRAIAHGIDWRAVKVNRGVLPDREDAA